MAERSQIIIVQVHYSFFSFDLYCQLTLMHKFGTCIHLSQHFLFSQSTQYVFVPLVYRVFSMAKDFPHAIEFLIVLICCPKYSRKGFKLNVEPQSLICLTFCLLSLNKCRMVKLGGVFSSHTELVF